MVISTPAVLSCSFVVARGKTIRAHHITCVGSVVVIEIVLCCWFDVGVVSNFTLLHAGLGNGPG